MEERQRRLPWLTSGDRPVLVFLCIVLFALIGGHYVLRAGLGTPAPEFEGAAKLKSHAVDINRAEWWELQALQGIGEKRARDIVDYRDRNRPFASVDDLVKVRGIGEKTLARLRPHLTASPAEGTNGRRR